jgi:hypothetical protein
MSFFDALVVIRSDGPESPPILLLFPCIHVGHYQISANSKALAVRAREALYVALDVYKRLESAEIRHL